jgi:Crinkler effector protein N-terminal domain
MFPKKKFTLNCWITDDKLISTFPITIPATNTVHDLKMLIIGMNSDLRPIVPRLLELWVVSIPLPLSKPNDPEKDEHAIPMEGTRPLFTYFRDGPANDCLHIIVKGSSGNHSRFQQVISAADRNFISQHSPAFSATVVRSC